LSTSGAKTGTQKEGDYSHEERGGKILLRRVDGTLGLEKVGEVFYFTKRKGKKGKQRGGELGIAEKLLEGDIS